MTMMQRGIRKNSDAHRALGTSSQPPRGRSKRRGVKRRAADGDGRACASMRAMYHPSVFQQMGRLGFPPQADATARRKDGGSAIVLPQHDDGLAARSAYPVMAGRAEVDDVLDHTLAPIDGSDMGLLGDLDLLGPHRHGRGAGLDGSAARHAQV